MCTPCLSPQVTTALITVKTKSATPVALPWDVVSLRLLHDDMNFLARSFQLTLETSHSLRGSMLELSSIPRRWCKFQHLFVFIYLRYQQRFQVLNRAFFIPNLRKFRIRPPRIL